jgi:hypothetical protein
MIGVALARIIGGVILLPLGFGKRAAEGRP